MTSSAREAEYCCCAGATYARAFKIPAFGPVPKDRPDVEHGPNEYMPIDDIVKLAEVIAAAIKRKWRRTPRTGRISSVFGLYTAARIPRGCFRGGVFSQLLEAGKNLHIRY